MVIKTMYNYTYRSELRRIYVELADDVVTARRYEEGELTDDLGTYEWADGEIVGSGPLSPTQRAAIADLLQILTSAP